MLPDLCSCIILFQVTLFTVLTGREREKEGGRDVDGERRETEMKRGKRWRETGMYGKID